MKVTKRVILAMGGGGFTMEPNNQLLDRFLLDLSPARQPRILFLATASGDTVGQINAFYARFTDWPCRPEHVSLFRLGDLNRPLGEMILTQDLIYVGGGSMRNLLAIWRAHELDVLLAEAWRRGTILAGLSAGAMCWFQKGITCSDGQPGAIDGLGLLPGSLSVHADGEPRRLPVFLEEMRHGVIPGGWAVDDGVGLLFVDGRLTEVVSSRIGAGAQRVDAIAGELVRESMKVRLLGEPQHSAQSIDDEDVRELRRVQRLQRGLGQGGRIRGI